MQGADRTKLPRTVDLLCRVIDNYGDIGVALRLLRSIHERAPRATLRLIVEGLDQVAFILKDFSFFEIIDWEDFEIEPSRELLRQTDLVIETFGQGWPSGYDLVLASANAENPTLLINLEYLSNEVWVSEFHKVKGLLPHPFVKRHFFMPGLHQGTGGLVNFGRPLKHIESYSKSRHKMLVFYYNYPPELFLDSFFAGAFDVYLAHGRTLESFEDLQKGGGLPSHLTPLPKLNQREWDEHINAMDVIFVRGEESLSHALCSGIPFLWQTYPLKNKEHEPKTRAIIDFVKQHAIDCPEMLAWERLMLHINDIKGLGYEENKSHLIAFLRFAKGQKGRLSFLQCAKEVAMAGDLIDNLFSFYQDMV